MMRRTILLVTAAVLAGLAAPSGAQVTPPDSTPRADSVRPVAARPLAPRADTTATDSLTRRRVTPRGAFLRSLVLPGWGQSEVGAPERGAIYFALEAGSLWMVYKTQQKLEEARDQELIRRAAGDLGPNQRSGLVRERLAQREDWITLSVFWMFFSGADAFVAAHLRDFDEHVGVVPSPSGGAALQVTLPVGK
jgi:hypothetical protein